MPVSLPPWFVEKYSVPADKATTEQPAPTSNKSPYSKYPGFSLIEPADTQQERERLPQSVIPSTERKIDPAILEKFSKKNESPFFANPPARTVSPFEPGKKVFTDQEKLNQIIAEAPEDGRIVSFKEAFKRARKAGLEEFEYKGDRFNTQQKGETSEQWLSTLRQNKVPQTFEEYMQRSGVIAAPEKNIDLSVISKDLGPALERIGPIFQEEGITPEITSGQRSWGKWSLHEIGEAIDVRLKTVNPQTLKRLEDSLPGTPTDVSVEDEKGRMWSDGNFQYFIYGEGDNLHLHIERESPEVKQRLAEHMIEQGLRDKIPQKELQDYLTSKLNKLKLLR